MAKKKIDAKKPAKPRKRAAKSKSHPCGQTVPTEPVSEVPKPCPVVPQDAVVVMPPSAEVIHVADRAPPLPVCTWSPHSGTWEEYPAPAIKADDDSRIVNALSIAGVVVLIVVVLAALLSSCSAQGAEPTHPYATARAQALGSGKPLVVLLESDDCGPCKQLVKDCGVQIRAKGVFVDLNWERDRLTIDRIVPRGRVIVPTVIVWRRGIGGNWVKVELRGAGEIREWAKGEKR
jgi:hypothetical protein